ncbi:class I SAM-dependent methyltransferase [Robertkochia aurantiaca]|uniref:class I SAM-dependent methyltransferase n=1 Tax=Robertkochia aurantiaca TaxID=2873700 RepID=UPI001CC9DA45|nr:class I SAM-dependent methyltransferase [Robertkochia sp. 3YJGBD-33]
MEPPLNHFSDEPEKYRSSRPFFPEALIQEVMSMAKGHALALDAGTGNGQLAGRLVPGFDKVIGLDISLEQISVAFERNRVEYRQGRAEDTGLPEESVDLITCAQSFHWFDRDAFYKEVLRILKPNGLLALLGYGLIQGDDRFNAMMDDFYHQQIYDYWPERRRWIEAAYQNFSFPFDEVQLTDDYQIEVNWDKASLMNYLSSWSAVKCFQKANSFDPVRAYWEGYQMKGSRRFTFPVFYRIGYRPIRP